MSSNPNPENPGDDYIHASLQRRDTELSSAASEYDQTALNMIPSSEQGMDVYRDSMNGNLRLVSSKDKSPLYFIRSSLFLPGVPDVTMYEGGDKNGGVVGVCNFAAFSTSITVGHGDPARPYRMEWEEVSKTSRDHSFYKFSIGSTGEERKLYSWKRTHDPNLKGTKSSGVDRRSWKLEYDATGQIVAVFAAYGINKSWKKAGKLRLLATEGKEWEEWILLTCLGLYEKARRRAIARRDLSWFF